MIALIDNYDSFTYNLVHYIGELGQAVEVWRNDAISVSALLATNPRGIVLSPGPCDPDKAGICLQVVEQASGRIPILGVCLGHQSIGQAFGGNVIRAPQVMHGKISTIRHRGDGIFANLPDRFIATRYHSLIVDRSALPACLSVTAETEDGIIMGLTHKEFAVDGVQFHPESIASEHGHLLLQNFITSL